MKNDTFFGRGNLLKHEMVNSTLPNHWLNIYKMGPEPIVITGVITHLSTVGLSPQATHFNLIYIVDGRNPAPSVIYVSSGILAHF